MKNNHCDVEKSVSGASVRDNVVNDGVWINERDIDPYPNSPCRSRTTRRLGCRLSPYPSTAQPRKQKVIHYEFPNQLLQ